MDPISIGLIIGIVTLLIERTFYIIRKIKKSNCCGNEVEFKN
jgi:hypothetical protein